MKMTSIDAIVIWIFKVDMCKNLEIFSESAQITASYI